VQQQDREQHALPIAPKRNINAIAASPKRAKDSIVQALPRSRRERTTAPENPQSASRGGASAPITAS
jgi:hypothetical protein